MSDYPLDRLIRFLPQKPPFLFLDHVLRVEPMSEVEGLVRFADGHPIFENHLPGEPLVPGVIILESLAQLAGLTLMDPAGAPIRGYLAEVKEARFYRLVHPDEELHLFAKLEQAFGRYARFAVETTVAGERTTRGVITLARRE